MEDRLPRDRYGRPLPLGSRDQLKGETDLENEVVSTLQALWQGIALFDEQRFFEAHERFEYVWKADDIEDRDRRFWKGVTQVAVGCCHAQRENDRGALALMDRAVGHLRGYPSSHLGVETNKLIDVARRVADQVRRLGASPGLDFPRFPEADGSDRFTGS